MTNYSSYIKHFNFSNDYKLSYWVVIIVCLFMVGLTIYPNIHFYTENPEISGIIFFTLSVFLWIVSQFLQRENYSIRIDEHYIDYSSQSKKRRFLLSEIHAISDNSFFRRVTLTDKDDKIIININYETSFFEELITTLVQSTQLLKENNSLSNSYRKVLWALPLGFVFLSSLYLITYVLFISNYYLFGMFCFLLTSYFFYLILINPKRVTIKNDSIIVSSLLQKRQFFFSNIYNINVEKREIYRYHTIIFVSISLKTGKAIELRAFNTSPFVLAGVLHNSLNNYKNKL